MPTRSAGSAFSYLAVVALLVGAFLALSEPAEQTVLYNAVGASALVAVLVGVRRHQPTRATPWYLLCAALALAAAGNVTWWLFQRAGADPAPGTTVYLACYLVAISTTIALIRSRSPTVERGSLLDAAIFATGGGVVVWVFIAQHAWTGPTLAWGERVPATAYPLLVLVLLAAVARLALGPGARVRSFWYLAVGLMILSAADLWNAMLLLQGTAGTGSIPEALRMLAFGTLGASALHPSMPLVTEPGEPARVQLSRPRLVALWVTATAAPVTLVVRLGVVSAVELVVVSLGAIVLFTLVAARMWGLLTTLAEYVRRESEDRFRALVENAHDVVIIVDDHFSPIYVSPSTTRVWGYSDDPASLDLRAIHPDDRTHAASAFERVRSAPQGVTLTIEGRIRHADGSWRHVEAAVTNQRDNPAIAGLLVTARDVTQRRDLEQQLTHQAFHDALTGLPNRALFLDRTANALRQVRAGEPGLVAVLFCDLDDFKTVNDSLGHAHGDELLHVLAERLHDETRTGDTAARMGGDEFAVLIPHARSVEEVIQAATRILAAVSQPVTIAHQRIQPQLSMGAAVSTPQHSATDLLRDADAAMYQAKRNSDGDLQVFKPAMHAQAIRRLQLKADLRKDLEQDALMVALQPICATDTGAVRGLEALARWQHPQLGSVSPAEFIPLAEQSGLIIDLGVSVLDRACRDVARLRADTGCDLFASVNVSAVQLGDPALLSSVSTALTTSGLPAHRLTLELTESVFLDDGHAVEDTLRALHQLGVQLAIDDFGTGYCALSYLGRFRFDVVKIDKHFIDHLAEPSADPRLTLGILELIETLQVPAVAEGIETPEQLEQLQLAGCEFGQGYLWSPPRPRDEIKVLLDGPTARHS